jgi:hypothetical protein
MRVMCGLILSASLAVGCSEHTTLQPTPLSSRESSQQSATTTTIARPLQGECQTTFLPIEVPAAGTCPVFEPVPSAFIAISGDCVLTHLGRSTTSATQQLIFALDTNGQPILIGGQPLVTRLVNCGVFVAANGDELRHTTAAVVQPGATPGTVTFQGSLSFNGGTGRFVTSTGTANLTGAASVTTSTGNFSLDGNLTY